MINNVDGTEYYHKDKGIHSFEHTNKHLHPAQDPGWPGPVFTITDSICGFSFHTAEHS